MEKPHEYDESGDLSDDSTTDNSNELQQLKERILYLEKDNKLYMAKIDQLTETVSKQRSRLAAHDDSIFVDTNGTVTKSRTITAPTEDSPSTPISTETGSSNTSSTRKIENNWTPKNTDTVRNWKNTISKFGFIYDYVRDKYKKLLDDVLLAALIINTISMTISAISTSLLAIGSYQWVSFSLNVCMLMLTGGCTVLTGAVKIFKWDEIVANISAYIEKLDGFYAITASELLIPDKLREDAVNFIKKNDDTFMSLMKATPNLDSGDSKKAAVAYKQFVDDETKNFKCSQKYSKVDSNIDVF